MKKIITGINHKDKIFYIIESGRKIGFHLTNKLAKTFFDYLDEGILVDFEIGSKTKRIKNRKYFQVAHFNQIISLNPYRIHYDLKTLQHEMKNVLMQDHYYLFIDFEMTMPGYTDVTFLPEIIQVGYVLSKIDQEIILKDGYYVKPILRPTLSKRTKRFLKLDDESFFSQAKPYETFYQDLKIIVDTYHPKFVVWGKNDITALSDSYMLNHKTKLTNDMDFIDLLKLHKDYYNLKDDLGLFKAYKTYYQIDFHQVHDAIDDATVTKLVFDAFIKEMI